MLNKKNDVSFNDRDIEAAKLYVRKVIDDLRNNKIPLNKLIIRTQLTKPIESYAAVGPHVAAAQKMKELGKEPSPGTIIEYIIKKGKGIIRDKVCLVHDAKQEDYDGEYYVKHQIIPGVERIFDVLDISTDELLSDSKQEGLGKFL